MSELYKILELKRRYECRVRALWQQADLVARAHDYERAAKKVTTRLAFEEAIQMLTEILHEQGDPWVPRVTEIVCIRSNKMLVQVGEIRPFDEVEPIWVRSLPGTVPDKFKFELHELERAP